MKVQWHYCQGIIYHRYGALQQNPLTLKGIELSNTRRNVKTIMHNNNVGNKSESLGVFRYIKRINVKCNDNSELCNAVARKFGMSYGDAQLMISKTIYWNK